MSVHTKFYGYRQQASDGDKSGARNFKEFDATQLYCPRCKQAVAVRKRLLLVLPEGDKYEYLCSVCYASVGTKIDRKSQPLTLIE
jgi:hypothetical protein